MKALTRPSLARRVGLLAFLVFGAHPVPAQSPPEAYRAVTARVDALRRSAAPPPEDYLALIRGFEAFVREYPDSPSSPGALLHAASLAHELFVLTGDRRERERATDHLQALLADYPASNLRPRAMAALDRLDTPAVIQSVTHTEVPGGVEVAIQIDSETPFRHQRLADPPRVYVDLIGATMAAPDVMAPRQFGDGPLRNIRLGRRAPDTTRIVLDLDALDDYDIRVEHAPFRLVVRAVFPDSWEPRPELQAAADPTPFGTDPIALSSISPAAGDPLPIRSEMDVQFVPPVGTTPLALPPAAPSTNDAGGFSISRQLGLGASRIVIDPGHGGHDPGALRDGLSEATLVLDIAKRLGALLETGDPAIEVVFTRTTDTYVALEERTALANRHAADLFLSIHANASENQTTRGIETYFLNFATTPEAEAVAARENATSAQRMSSLPALIRSIAANNKREESQDFATAVQRALVRKLGTAGMKDFGVKQAPFVVLIGAEMPSVLSEVAFVTNEDDHRLLGEDAYRDRIAAALADGIVEYLTALKKTPARVARQTP